MPATGATPEGEVIVTINPLQLSAVQLSARHCVGRSWVAASGLDGFVCASAPCSKSRKDSPQRHRDTEKSAGALCGVAPLGGRRFEAPRVAAALCLCVYYENTPRVGTLAGAASTYYAAFAVIWTSYPMARSRFVRLMAVR